MSRGKLITFEGIDGCGKTTQSKMLADFLSAIGRDVILTREPGGETEVCKKIRSLIFDNNEGEEICKEAELLLFAADRAQHLNKIILPAIERGSIVICDRYMHSTYAYQGCEGVGKNKIDLANLLAKTIRPDLTIFLKVIPALAKSRVNRRGSSNKYDDKDINYYSKLARKYETAFNCVGSPYYLIEYGESKEKTHCIIRDLVFDFLKKPQ